MKSFVLVLLYISMTTVSFPSFAGDMLSNYLCNTRAPDTNWASTIRSSKIVDEEIVYDEDGKIIDIIPNTVEGKRVVDPIITELNDKDLIAVMNPNKCHRVFGAKNSKKENVYYKESRREAIVLLNYLKDNDSQSRVYFQLGNEVNDYQEVKTISDWVLQNKGIDLGCKKDEDEKYLPDCEATIPYIVEYCMAPAMAAIKGLNGNLINDRVYFMLPSVATAHRPSARTWLKALVAYEIQGSELTGGESGLGAIQNSKVGEVSDVVSVHYIMTGDSHFRKSNGKKKFYPYSFIDAMDELYNEYLNPSTKPADYNLTGVWSSEEQGSRRAWKGLGHATAVTVFARYNHYWNYKGMNSDQGRANYYGTERHSCKDTLGKTPLNYCDDSLTDEELNETKGSFSMNIISSFLPSSTRLANIDVQADMDLLPDGTKSADYERFGFRNGADDKRIVVVNPVQQKGGKLVKSVTIPSRNWTGSAINVKGHIFRQNDYEYLRTPEFTVEADAEEYKIIFNNAIEIKDGAVILLTIRNSNQ